MKTWTENNGFSISQNKSSVCTFTRKRTILPSHIQLGPYLFAHKNSVKYLGITLDRKLLWRDHIQQIIKRTENSINIIRVFTKSTWGADPNTALLFYQSLVRSIMDYGSILYGSASDTQLRKIDIVKNKCLRLCLGLLNTTPINTMEVETCEPPLPLRRQFLSDKFVMKLYAKKSECINSLHKLFILNLTSPYWSKKKSPVMVNSYQSLLVNSSHCYTINADPYYTISYNDFLHEIKVHYLKITEYDSPGLTNKLFQYESKHKWPNSEYIFTDGSKIDDQTGCAFYHENKNYYEMFKLPDESSIFTAEQYAVQKAMEYAKSSPHFNYVIFTDCKSLVDKLRSTNKITKVDKIYAKILSVHGELKQMNKNLEIVWIKGHIGIKSNETVDHYAKTAVTMGRTTTESMLPPSDLTPIFRRNLKLKWQNIYEDSLSGAVYKQIQPTIRQKTWFHNLVNRQFIKTITRLRTNHALYPKYQHKIGQTNNPNCLCGEIGDLQHIILECPLHITHRDLLLEEIYKLKAEAPFNLTTLLASDNLSIFNSIFGFIKRSSIRI
ncbi:uncharacterized protein LOC108915084 [Anoplophora glabripennis]|uniref:uncharacterized protein LOC108915084 n=1 Tax=Anoplophora glabripennis TaxID=217634 RepID=UPI000873EDB2|nr:uncharacterized protein LOC108915084 [Anoplophora glabripennis]